MLARIQLLKREIERLRKLATSCDPDIARQILSLIDEMQAVVKELEEDARRLGARNS